MTVVSRTPLELSDKDQILNRQIETSLNHCRTKLVFPDPLERLYHDHIHKNNRRQVISAAIGAILLYCSFYFVDMIYRPELMTQLLVIRLSVIAFSLAALSGVLILKDNVRLPGLLSLAGIFATSLAGGLMLSLPENPIVTYEPYTFILVAVAGNIVLPLRFRLALIATVANLAIATYFILQIPVLTPDQKASPLIFLLASSVLTLFASFRLEASERKAFLFYLHEKLYADALLGQYQILNRISLTDSLTGIANRRRFDSFLSESWAAAAVDKHQVAMLMIDVDHFKRFNDAYGHPAGDACLRQVATLIRRSTRQEVDLAARLGGEEFAVIVSQGGIRAAQAIARRIERKFAIAAIPHRDGVNGRITLSIGIASGSPENSESTAEDLIANADTALYQAKRKGRNRTCIEEETLSDRREAELQKNTMAREEARNS
ncbi:GGDEF domain-containing protein [Martelella mediterranea]|uniref:diguanylate cyclase n=1 Tax=Martelella mediterranea TaxID=293089 RepID=A0A4R3NWK4_9HYPH|nr:diguanylate cyclase [Martelella mediterranea]TCT43188.1 diguanylate cyclase (GGDEF)-like protein [Martelella mediterranea]